ncbi:MAG: YicC family protein [Betaproteobacteria bacterium]|nr:YicC family protein [Betaproteobacteria bacterium]
MTGFGLASRPLSGASLTVELRSVNSRFLDLFFKLPEELRIHEQPLREALAAQLKRGKVEIRAQLERTAAAADLFDTQALRAARDLQQRVLGVAPDAAPLSVAELLRWPGVMAAPADPVQMGEALKAALQDALQGFLESRAREGAKLAGFMAERCDAITALAEQAAVYAPQAVDKQQQRFLERWREALKAAQAEGPAVASEAAAERALSEAAAYALRIDVAEEISRLAAHTTECKALLLKGGELGKRLDFLVQEMHREANTLGSKSASLELTRVSMEMKVAIEQMREQVQNIE